MNQSKHPSGFRCFTKKELEEMPKEEFDKYEIMSKDSHRLLYVCKRKVLENEQT